MPESVEAQAGLSPRARWMLVLVGALLGALIGPTGFWLRGLEATEQLRERSGSAPGPPLPWSAPFTSVAASAPQVIFMTIAFLATGALMPLLIRWLERSADRPAPGFYPRAAVGGILLGFGATILTAMGIFLALLVVGIVNPDYAGTTGRATAPAGAMAVGAAVFAPIVGITVPFLFLKWIMLFGVPFGLLFGAAIRWLDRRR